MRYAALLALAILSGAGLALGLVAVWDRQSAPPIIIRDPLPDATLIVSVEGAVGTPGLYPLRGDARVADAVAHAGGALPDADFREINLAARLSDGDRIVIPPFRELAQPGGSPAAQSAEIQPALGGTNRIDINTALAEELDTLPGIGPVLAGRIIEDRAARGPYATVSDLARVSGISAEMVEAISPLVTVQQ